MLIQKLRLKHGWSQQQLANSSGLSVRTIQRIEAGQPANTETLKSIAAVFEIDFSTLNAEPATMTTVTSITENQEADPQLRSQTTRLLLPSDSVWGHRRQSVGHLSRGVTPLNLGAMGGGWLGARPRRTCVSGISALPAIRAAVGTPSGGEAAGSSALTAGTDRRRSTHLPVNPLHIIRFPRFIEERLLRTV